MQTTKLLYNSPNYPDALRQIASPPKQLYARGELPTGPMVAIVGTRTPSDYGRYATYKLAGELAAAGIVIVSGLALGLDSLAHKGAIDAGGQTIAVLGTAIDRIYPSINYSLAKRILDGRGAIISEYPPGYKGHKGVFPARNRIIAGLSLATLVTEANAKSGSLLTANNALHQDRLVMGVPGNINNPRSAGPNNIIKAGGIAVTDFTDVLTALNLGNIAQAPIKAKSKEEADILDLMKAGHTNSQALIEQSGMSAAQFANIISLMEITGKVRNLGAGQWVNR